MGRPRDARRMLRVVVAAALLVCIANAIPPAEFSAAVEDARQAVEQSNGKCCLSCTSPKNMYYSIADDSGPWLCGQTCIRDSFYWIFHFFEKILSKASDNSPCANAGYTKYNSTVTHGGGGLYCTLDLYECATGSGNCPHPSTL